MNLTADYADTRGWAIYLVRIYPRVSAVYFDLAVVTITSQYVGSGEDAGKMSLFVV
jgi:hypothetical protein